MRILFCVFSIAFSINPSQYILFPFNFVCARVFGGRVDGQGFLSIFLIFIVMLQMLFGETNLGIVS